MSELEIAQQFYTFANNPQFRPILLNDPTTTASLLSCLKSTNPEVVKSALETIFVLASDANSALATAKLDGLLTILANLTEFEIECDEQASIKRLAQQNMNCLGKAARRQSTATSSERVVLPSSQTVQGKAFGSKYNHQVTFSVPNIEGDEDKRAVESALLHLKGTLAVTVDLHNKTANCFTSAEVVQYTAAALEALADYDPAVVDNTKKSKRPGASDAALVSYNKNKAKPKQQQEAGWLGGITSYFW